MLVKTSDLIGPALDWAVAKSAGATNLHYDTIATWWITLDGKDRALSKGWAQAFTPSIDWNHGGPVIFNKRISIVQGPDIIASIFRPGVGFEFKERGPTVLVAAMRTYVASQLGNTVEIPEELC